MKSSLYLTFAASLLLGTNACGPSARNGVGDDDGSGSGSNDAGSGSGSSRTADAGPCTANGDENSVAACSDGIDNDCDGLIDCNDPNCSGIGACPVCGMVQHPLSSPLPLPDGVDGGSCTPGGAACPVATPTCAVIDTGDDECRASYISKLNFTGFSDGQTITSPSNILSVCVNMEHSWMRDLQIDLVAPSGEVIPLEAFGGRMGGEVYLGIADDCDDAADPVPGVGSDYCWTPTATKPNWLAYANANMPLNTVVTTCTPTPGSAQSMPPGNYQAAGMWTSLVGATLNGDWSIRVTDDWEVDNGYMFKWSLAFDPTIVQNCTGPVIQ